MGLDMSIIRKRKVRRGRPPVYKNESYSYREYYKDGERLGIDIKVDDNMYECEARLRREATDIYDIYEVVYWRKANQIHKWFVDNVQGSKDDCGRYRLTEKNLRDLLNICQKILDTVVMKKGKINNGYSYKKNIFGKMVKKYDKVPGRYIKNPRICKKLLPACKGFFFGNTNYDEYYYDQILYTRDKLEEILDTYDLDIEELYYESSW